MIFGGMIMLCVLMNIVDTPEEKRKIEKLYEKYNRLMYAVAYNIMRHVHDAEDVVLESWEKIIRHLDKINEIDSQDTKNFIVIIVERTAIDLYRKNKKRKNVLLHLSEFEESPFFAVKENMFESIELYEVMRNMPKTYSDVLILYYINCLSTKEIADLLKIKVGTVEKRLSRGRKLLRKELMEHE
jgi:RNA polymerase sigma-70 factor (ECF subfamily)